MKYGKIVSGRGNLRPQHQNTITYYIIRSLFNMSEVKIINCDIKSQVKGYYVNIIKACKKFYYYFFVIGEWLCNNLILC